MKSFKQYIREERPVGPSAERIAQVERELAAAKSKREQDPNFAAQQAAEKARAEKSDIAAGKEWADKKIDTAQKAVDYGTAALSATQVGKPAAAIMQGFSSAIDLTQGQYGDASGRALSAAVSAIPGSEALKVGSKLASPLSTASKAAVETVAGKLATTAAGKAITTAGSKLATSVAGTLATNPATQEALKTGIQSATKAVATKAASDTLKSEVVKPTINAVVS